MAQTAQTIITRAARSLGYLGRTSTLSAADANDALVIFNAMLDSWSNENLLSYVVLEQSFPLVQPQRLRVDVVLLRHGADHEIGFAGLLRHPYFLTSS